MKINLKNANTLGSFDWVLIIGIIALNFIYSLLEKQIDFIGTIAAVTGVICVVLVAKGNILNYLFGLINVMLYAYISFKAQLYGDAVLNAFYYLPMQFVGWALWLKRRDSSESVTVVAKRMSAINRIILIAVSVSLTLIVGYILEIYNDPQPYKDSATTVLSIIAMFVMVKAYMEQWVLWIVVNIISVIMWTVLYLKGADHSLFMVFMWIAYLANSINGLIVWIKLSGKRRIAY